LGKVNGNSSSSSSSSKAEKKKKDEEEEAKEKNEKKEKEKKKEDSDDDEEEEIPVPTVSELRELIVEKLARRQLFEGEIIFEADVKDEIESMLLKDHEWLDESIRKSRL